MEIVERWAQKPPHPTTKERPPRLTRSLRGLARGVTMIECCLALSILAILVGSGLPSMTDLLSRKRLEGQSQELVADILHMRNESIMRNVNVRMAFSEGPGGSCYVVHTGSAGACSCDGSGSSQCTGADAAVLTARHWLAGDARGVQANVNSILFDPRTGLAAPGGTVKLTDAAGREIRHIVSLRGRVRTCSPQAGQLNQPTCG